MATGTAVGSQVRERPARAGLLVWWACLTALLMTACSAGTPAAGSRPRRSTAGAVVPAIADVRDYRGGLARRGVMPGPAPVGRPVRLWTHLSPSGQSWPVAVAGGWALESENQALVALDLATGVPAWRAHLAGAPVGPLTVAGHTILVAVGTDAVQAFSTSNHQQQWLVHGAALGTQVSVQGHTAYFGTRPEGFSAVDLLTGAREWQVHVGPANSKHAIVSGMAYVGGDGDSRLTAVDLRTHHVRWRFDTHSDRVLTPAVAGGTVYVAGVAAGGLAGRHTALHALDAATGRQQWQFAPPGTPAMSGFAVGDRDVFIGLDAASGTVYAVNRDNGRVDWQRSIDEAVDRPALVGSTLFVGTGTGGLHAFDAATGEPLWRAAVTGYAEGVVVTGGLAVVATRDARDAPGSVTAFVGAADPRLPLARRSAA